MMFDLWRLKFCAYNLMARHSESGKAANECQPELWHLPCISDNVSVVLQCVLGAYYMEASYPAKRVESA